MRSFLLPSLNDPWRDWKINPIGNAFAALVAVGYLIFVACLFVEIFS